jgi:hypothetical protein
MIGYDVTMWVKFSTLTTEAPLSYKNKDPDQKNSLLWKGYGH